EGFCVRDLHPFKADLNETARGMNVNGDNYNPNNVEIRSYQDYMYYGQVLLAQTVQYVIVAKNAERYGVGVIDNEVVKQMRKTNILTGLAVALCTIAGCKNSEIVHPDFEYQSVYFASQYPVRTVVLGEDANFDNTLDKEGKVAIKATLGGTRYNANN